jgi:hypothetical protein
MGKQSDLSPECQKFVEKLFAFFSTEKATKKPIVSSLDRTELFDYHLFVYKYIQDQ